MKFPALLALLLLILIANTNEQDMKLAKVPGLTMQEWGFSLMSQDVPYIVNPNVGFDPPMFAVAILREDSLIGSGAILSKRFVLTLCVLIKNPKGENVDLTSIIKLRYPEFIRDEGVLAQNVTVSQIYIHPDCGEIGETDPSANLGLIRTNEVMDNVKYPKLPSIHIPEEEGKFVISNYREGNHAATDSHTAFWYVITKKVDLSLCEVLFAYDSQNFNPIANLCTAYYHTGNPRFCRGDMGQPLSIRHNGVDTLVGLNLHKHECGHPRETAAFICIRTNKKWIQEIIES